MNSMSAVGNRCTAPDDIKSLDKEFYFARLA